MCEITVEHETRTAEHGRSVLYQKRYRGILKKDNFQLLSYVEKRVPLSEAQVSAALITEHGNTKAAA